ncbi:MAG: flippase [bacterium]|nr:flippase [bacterium]
MTDIVTSEIDIASKSPEAQPFRYSGRQLARNSLYNYAGLIAPLVVGFVSIPVLVANLGTDRFGLLSLAWMVVGYFNIFDMGIGRATTKFVAEYSAQGRKAELAPLVLNALVLAGSGGLIGTILVSLLAPTVVNDWLNIPPELRAEALATMYVVAASIPILLTNACARGVLEAQQKFALANSIRVPSSVSAFLVPILVLPFSRDLFVIVLALTMAKTIVMTVYLRFALRGLGIWKYGRISRTMLLQLLGYGKWVTVSNIIAPMMGQADRFLVGSFLTLTAVAYYATPFDLMTKLFIIPTGLVTVLFPVFSSYSAKPGEDVVRLHQKAVRYILLTMLPIVVGAITLAEPFLNLWLNADFAAHSAIVLQLMAVGVLINSIARVPLSAIEALGRPDMTATMYLIELPIYIAALWFATTRFGIAGAAMVWTARLLIESILLFTLSARVIGTPGESLWPKAKICTLVLTSLALAWTITFVHSPLLRVAAAFGLIAGVVTVVWMHGLSLNERGEVLRIVTSRIKRGNS